MAFNLSALSSYVLVLAGFGAAFLLALWLSLIIWTSRDIRNRSRDRLLRILAVLVVALLFLPGIVIYLILRPVRTLDEEYQKTLEEEALLLSIDESLLCPECGHRVKDDWMLCPKCQTRLKRSCRECGRAIALAWVSARSAGQPLQQPNRAAQRTKP